MSKFKRTDAFFIALGGQAPFVSFFIFGGYVSSLLGPSSALATLIAGLIVFVNGLIVNELSKRFPYYGSYYVFSYFTLAPSLSFTTFWTYLLFNIAYAMAYLFGTTYMLSTFIFKNDFISFVISLIAIMSIYLLGKKPTAKYAIIAGSLELAIMFFLGLYFLFLANFQMGNIFEIRGDFAQGILFAAAIPTGYIVLSSIAEEVEESRKMIGRMMLLIIVIGTLLVAFDLYALSVLNIPIMNAISIGLSFLLFPVIIFTAINDGFLGVLAYMLSTIGLFKSMRYGLKDIFKRKTEFFSFFLYLLLPITVFYFVNDAYSIFEAVTYISMLANFFLNAMAAAALLRVAITRFIKRRSWIYQMLISIFALISNTIIVILNIQSGTPIFVYIFLAWIIIGFFISSIIETVKKIQEEIKEESNHA